MILVNLRNIVLTLFFSCGNLCLRPREAFIKSMITLRRLTRNSLLRWERFKKEVRGLS
jgi:hypothetical protein